MKLHPHLLYVVLPAHLVWLIALVTMSWSWVLIPLTLFLWIVIGGLGVEIGYHRLLSHSHFKTSSLTEKILCGIGIFGMQGAPIFWRALHVGYHHAYTDTKRDFHSPANGGYFNAYIGYINKLDKLRFIGCREQLEDSFYVNTQKYYNWIFWAAIVGAFSISSIVGLSLLTAMVLCFHQTALVNAVCHSSMGYTNFNTGDRSKNVGWLSWLTFGLALHNNHHKFPAAADFAVKDNEHDVGFILARLLRLTPRT